MITSFSHHITMDEIKLFNGSRIDGATPYVNDTDTDDLYWFRMKNPRKIYSITVGRLSWQTTDLAQKYGAKCNAGTDCNGLYFPLSNGNQHVVVDEAHMPTPSGTTLASYDNRIELEWFSGNTSTYNVDIIYPPNYRIPPDSLPLNLTDNTCAKFGSSYINSVMQQHVYSKDPVQPAYTAGLFWLFQNAAARNIESPSNSSNQDNVKLDFSGNLKWISPRVSTPLTSAIMSIVGCLLILIGGVVVQFWSRSQTKQDEFQRHLFSAHNVGNVLFNTNQFPPLLLRIPIDQSTPQDGIAVAQEEEDVHNYRVVSMILRRQTDTKECVLEIRQTESDGSFERKRRSLSRVQVQPNIK